VEIELEALDLSPAVPAENAQSGLSNLQSRWNAQGWGYAQEAAGTVAGRI